MKNHLLLLLLAALSGACSSPENGQSTDSEPEVREPILDTIFTLTADAETAPIKSVFGTDAADDPAIWIHPDDPSRSIIYGSNKTGGIAAYDLSGKEMAYAEVGRINNIDVAYNLQLADSTIDICGGTNRTTNAIDLFRIDPASGELTYILDTLLISEVDEVYGFCFYHSPKTGTNYAILCGKDGVVEQYAIREGGESLSLERVRAFDIGSQPEGLVADHQLGILYIGEENQRIWKVNAEPVEAEPQPLPLSSMEDNPNITYDIEGLTIYYTASDKGYLIASSQGNNSYAVYERYPENNYLGSFRIVDGIVDGTSDTDGIDVLNLNLGPAFPKGLFLAQDGTNLDGEETMPQNFKLMSWGKIADAFEPSLPLDTGFNLRSLFE